MQETINIFKCCLNVDLTNCYNGIINFHKSFSSPPFLIYGVAACDEHVDELEEIARFVITIARKMQLTTENDYLHIQWF